MRMLLSKGNPIRNKVILLLAVSILCYAVSSLMGYFVAVSISPGVALISTRIGSLIFLLTLLYLERGKVSAFTKLHLTKQAWIYGIAFALTGALIFTAYRSYTLSSVFPLIEGGSLVFLALDFLINRKKIHNSQVLPLILGVLIVFIGTYLCQSTGFTFDFAALPYIIGIIFFSGVGYYVMVYKTERDNTESKFLAYTIVGTIAGVILIPLQPIPIVLNTTFVEMLAIGVISGFLLCAAFITEIRAVVQSLKNNKRNDVGVRNFINNAAELDTVLVVLASIWIGSFTFESIIGGLILIVGVLILSVVT